MTLQLPNPTIMTEQTGMPGAAPVGSTMQGNPTPAQAEAGYQPPTPMTSSAQLAHTQIANGQITLNVQPTNVAVTPGGDSLMAMISRGQLSLNQSNYGQSTSTSAPAAVTTGQASGITLPGTPNFVGN